nr:hypothetical protein [Mycobacterium tuberculosis]
MQDVDGPRHHGTAPVRLMRQPDVQDVDGPRHHGTAPVRLMRQPDVQDVDGPRHPLERPLAGLPAGEPIRWPAHR